MEFNKEELDNQIKEIIEKETNKLSVNEIYKKRKIIDKKIEELINHIIGNINAKITLKLNILKKKIMEECISQQLIEKLKTEIKNEIKNNITTQTQKFKITFKDTDDNLLVELNNINSKLSNITNNLKNSYNANIINPPFPKFTDILKKCIDSYFKDNNINVNLIVDIDYIDYSKVYMIIINFIDPPEEKCNCIIS